MKIISIACMVFINLMISGTVYSSPTFEINTSSKTAEKGHTFQILITIKSDEPLHDIEIAVAEPEGFSAEAIASPGIVPVRKTVKKPPNIAKNEKTVEKPPNIAKIAKLGRNSSITATFKVWTPKLWGGPQAGAKKSLYSTRDPKKFPINIFYKNQHNSGEMNGSYSTIVTMRYTTSIGHYLAAGLFGVLLGFVVKIATQYKQEIDQSIKQNDTIQQKVKNLFYQIFVARLPLLLTLLIVGFGVLLSLAKDALPVTSWHQAIALGIGIGILSDEQLITKIKKIKF